VYRGQSMCWEPRPGNQVFATEEASNVAVNLCFKIADELERLGITTEMMRDKNFTAVNQNQNEKGQR